MVLIARGAQMDLVQLKESIAVRQKVSSKLVMLKLMKHAMKV